MRLQKNFAYEIWQTDTLSYMYSICFAIKYYGKICAFITNVFMYKPLQLELFTKHTNKDN